MAAPNGHVHPHANSVVDQSVADADVGFRPREKRLSERKIRHLVAQLEVPFELAFVEWRVTNTANDGKRGLIVPYANPRAYTDRLNTLLTPAGWTRKYSVCTSANFERAKDKKLVAKVLVTCELTIFGLGSHSATGEEFADSEWALTAAEAQSFKRAASCFGLGRYLYYFTGAWVDLDDHKRPRSVPQLLGWATPQGWLGGMRPADASRTDVATPRPVTPDVNPETESLITEIEAMAEPLGRVLYRGILRDIARVWNPRDIQNSSIQKSVLEQMQQAQCDVQRLQAWIDEVGKERLLPILRSLGINSLERVDTLDKLAKILVELESLAQKS